MLWRTHIRITLEIFSKLGIPLSEEEKERLKEGVIAPDKWGLADLPHHYAKERQIREYLLLSRKYFLRDDFLGAYYYLGVALHYIQDSYVSMASFYPNHHSWEESIDRCTYVSNLEETIRYWLRNNSFEKDRCLGLSSSLSVEVQGRDNTLHIATLSGHEPLTSFAKPIIDYNLGFRASYLVAKSVLSPRGSPELNLALRQSLAYYKSLMLDAELSFSQQIIQMANDIKRLKGKRTNNSAFVGKLKNFFLSLRVKVKELQLNSKYNAYVQNRHLLKVEPQYRNVIAGIVDPHMGWHNFNISKLDLGTVKKELIPIQEASRYFGVDEQAIARLVNNGIISSYIMQNQGIVIREEIKQVLNA
jgi:hypothetical protein